MTKSWIKKDLLIDLTSAVSPSDVAMYYNLSWRAAFVILLILVLERKIKITKEGFVGV